MISTSDATSEPNAATQRPETPSVEVPVTAHADVLHATDIALKGLQEITELETIGAHLGATSHSETVATLFFDCLLGGYPGWRWAASLAKVSPDDPVTVLEVELVPGERSLLAPEWVPWTERLAAFREAQAQQPDEEVDEATRAAAELDEDDDDDNVMDNDYDDYDVDLDGVDIDALDDDDDDSDSGETAPDEEE